MLWYEVLFFESAILPVGILLCNAVFECLYFFTGSDNELLSLKIRLACVKFWLLLVTVSISNNFEATITSVRFVLVTWKYFFVSKVLFLVLKIPFTGALSVMEEVVLFDKMLVDELSFLELAISSCNMSSMFQ